jgi:aspartate aminotransferase
MGAVPVIVPTRSEDGFAVHADAVIAAISPKTKAIILNSPGNPTGALIDERAVAAIADVAAARGIWIIVDSCYERLIYEPVPHNLPKVLFERHRDRTVIAGSASKAYAMTGWRCGWTIAPAAVVAAENAIQSHATSNVNSIAQKAVLAAVRVQARDREGSLLETELREGAGAPLDEADEPLLRHESDGLPQ